MEGLQTLTHGSSGPMRVRALKERNTILVIRDDYSRFTVSSENSLTKWRYWKRRNRTLVEAARTMMIFSKAPMFLWAEAVATACYTQNRSLIHTRHNKTPYELVHEKKPDLTFFRERLYDYNKRTRRLWTQFTSPSMRMARHGPVRISSGPVSVIMTSGQLKSGLAPTDKELEMLFQPMFDEHLEQSPVDEQVPSATEVNAQVAPPGTSLSTTIAQDAPSTSASSSTSDRHLPIQHQEIPEDTPIIHDKKSSSVQPEGLKASGQILLTSVIVRRKLSKGLSKHQGVNSMAEQIVPAQPPTRTDEQIVPRSQWLTIGKSNLLFNAQKIQKNPIFQISVDILKIPTAGYPEPNRLCLQYTDELMLSPWRAIRIPVTSARQERRLQGTKPETSSANGCGESRLKNPKKESNSSPHPLDDFQSNNLLLGKKSNNNHRRPDSAVHTPVARLEAIRIFLAFASYMGFIVYQMDVKSTFLYGKIDEEVYVSQPTGFLDPKYP
ncbi:retrovirus-related pol polyprotein from transposon TNT 1-94 [Tanacetum coccineum]